MCAGTIKRYELRQIRISRWCITLFHHCLLVWRRRLSQFACFRRCHGPTFPPPPVIRRPKPTRKRKKPVLPLATYASLIYRYTVLWNSSERKKLPSTQKPRETWEKYRQRKESKCYGTKVKVSNHPMNYSIENSEHIIYSEETEKKEGRNVISSQEK